jgi:hypothetical protein
MKFPFETSEQDIFDFEQLLKDKGLTIEKNSDLEKISLAVLETNAKHKKEIEHNNSIDIQHVFSDVAGIVDFVKQILKHKNHTDFNQIIPHLQLLNTSLTATLTTKSRVTDDGNNKLLELYIALLCMSFATNVRLDDPKNSKGDNPDIMFDFNNQRWAIACKAIHTKNEKTLYGTIEKGTEQINRSFADKGIVLVNFKNIIDRNQIWPLTNQEENEKNGDEPLFGCFPSIDEPVKILQSYGCDYQKKLIDTIGLENLLKLSESKKCPQGFLIFLQAMTAIQHEGQCPATILKTFNLVQFDNITDEYKELATKLNESMHNRI